VAHPRLTDVEISVIVPTHAPHPGRLARTLAGLRAQTLPASRWEILLVDNASQPPVAAPPGAPANLRIVPEPELGLTAARRRGFRESLGDIVVLVDDDNVLASDYLERVLALFAAHPKVGALGGRSIGEFEAPRPPWWRAEFDGLIACRDLGPAPLFSEEGSAAYPACAPIGAGMALRRAAVQSWLDDTASGALPDRRGTALTSSGDNDIVFSLLRAGWQAAYFPELVLAHLIPAARIAPAYLARLNRGIQRSWVIVLARHGQCPWRAIPRWTVPLRAARAWLRCAAWRGPAEAIAFHGLLGRLEGQSDLSRLS
jgi:glycosyltransferase involved in cell wall biosynthesis